MPDADATARKWRERTELGMLGHLQYTVGEIKRELARMGSNIDHLHADVCALREVLNVPRPECYPDAETKRGARRARRAPPPPPPEAAPSS